MNPVICGIFKYQIVFARLSLASVKILKNLLLGLLLRQKRSKISTFCCILW